MAEHHSGHHVVDNDYVEHEKTYNVFLTLTKWGTIGTILLLVLIGAMTHTVPWAFFFGIAILLFAASAFV